MKTAPLSPPGAAPTLTTIYNNTDIFPPSEPSSQLNSQSTEPPRSRKYRKTSSTYRKHPSTLRKAPPASLAVKGTEAEKKRVQGIADSLDLGGDIEPRIDGDDAEGVGVRRATVVGIEEESRIITEDDRVLMPGPDERVTVEADLPQQKKRYSVD